MNTTRNLLASAFVGLVILGSANVKADFTFGNPVKVGLGLGVQDRIDCLSYDGLEMYIAAYSYLPGGQGTADIDICVLRRTSKDDDWGPPENLGPTVNSANFDLLSSISADGLTLYFCSDRLYGDDDHYDIFVSTRATRGDPWGQAVNAGPTINGPGGINFGSAWISPNGLELYVVSHTSERAGGYGARDIWVARRATTSDPWVEPVNLGPPVNRSYGENLCSLSPDGLLLLFSPNWGATTLWPGAYGGPDLYMARRASLSDAWQAPVNLGPQVNGPSVDIQPRISPDGSTLYFLSNRGGSYYAWEAPIVPVVDFNGDGKVDGNEVLAMAQHWGENYPPCDIAPFAWGDGVVDTNDLTVLAGYIGQDVHDPTLLAYWALDETEGMTATDSAGDNDAMVLGGATWQADGKIGGALAFDGKDDFARSGKSVLDPANGPFSVIAWIKGGGPNRVIVSQSSGADWLYLNQYGMLTTDVKSSGKEGTSLTSDAWLLDDQWHRVVLTWDGTNRALYTDGVEVARDTQPDLAASSGNLHIGAGKNLTPATFWTGLIDEVRIYNRAVAP